MKKLIMLLALLSNPALAYNDHASWSLNRGGYMNGSYQFITQSEIIHSDLKLIDVNSKEETTQNFKGMGVKVSTGTEVNRFVRFAVYTLSRDLTDGVKNSFRANEIGGETSVSFYGPLVNVQFGLGLYGVREVLQTPTLAASMFGSGFTGMLSFERFVNPKASLIFSVKSQTEQLRPEDKKIEVKGQAKNIGVSAGLIFWF